jgi:hypothetical protein
VQQDCARFSEDLAQLVPTVTFGARDGSAADLPMTTVYVDDVLVTSRLDDGRMFELDPGKHVVRYVHDGKEITLNVVLNQGERGRVLVATFAERAVSKRDPRAPADIAELPTAESRRSLVPLVVAGIGAAAAITGATLFAVGASNVPDTCSMATKECAAPPGDPAFASAESGVRLANAGLAVGITGAIALVGGIVWYLVQPAGGDGSRRARTPGPLFAF